MRLIDADELKTAFPACDNSKPVLVACVRATINHMPTIEPERKKGKWIEHHVYADEEKVIEEWQSCKCSVCGRYDTRPYLYNFDEPHFCSWCGADMRQIGAKGEKDAEVH